jgi:putative molybdopterin biosynthesis protein
MRDQDQFLQVLDRDEAERRFRAALDLSPRGIERVPLDAALGRVLAADVQSPVDVPSFDRSNVDGYAVVAQDTFGASEEVPRVVRLLDESIGTGVVPTRSLAAGEAMAIATGGMIPRGADAVVMVEHADLALRGTAGTPDGDRRAGPVDPPARDRRRAVPTDPPALHIRRAVTAGSGISFAATDITAGETVVRRGQLLTSRDTGVLAAIGVAEVDVWRRPLVAIVSTGDEIIAPGTPMAPSLVYDSNAQVLADAVRELGAEPWRVGIVPDDETRLRATIRDALARADVVLLSGGTSKGNGDVSYRVVSELRDPGIVAHGVALKPGKPICLAVTGGRPVVVLPGFPTSAIFTFHEFVAPVLRALAGRVVEDRGQVQARLAVRVNSEIGRTEYLLVGLVDTWQPAAASTGDQAVGDSADLAASRDGDGNGPQEPREKRGEQTGQAPPVTLAAYPMGQGSGSVTTFSRADGFTTIGRHDEIVRAGTVVDVTLLGAGLQLADLVVIGSHCIGLDYLLGEVQARGCRSKFMAVGSQAGLDAAARGECDLAGIHLLDPRTGEYNRPYLTPALELLRGYGRLQGIVFRPGDARFEGRTAEEAIAAIAADRSAVMVNRNAGSGTRVLIDRLLHGAKPAGYAIQPRNHNAVAAAVRQGRADWGVTLDTIASRAGLGFIPVQHEQFDFVIPRARAERPALALFRELLAASPVRARLVQLGMRVE